MAAINALPDQNNSACLASPNSGVSVQTNHIKTCTKRGSARAKCSSGIDSERKCNRCLHMQKSYRLSPSIRRQRASKKTALTKASEPKEKPGSPVTLPNSTQCSLVAQDSTTFDPAPVTPILQSLESRPNSIVVTADSPNCAPATPYPTNSTSFDTFSKICRSQPTFYPSPEEAESYLDKFRNDFIQHLPFIVIPLSMTAYQLRNDRPLLWMSIMTVASNISAQQIALSKELRSIFSRESFIEGTRSMDLLLGILVYTAWDRRYHFGQPASISLVQLALVVLYDLGLDKPPSQDPALMLAYELQWSTKPFKPSRIPTNEERRVLLGCFLLSSASCFTLRKGNTLRWTAYADECLNTLDVEKEFESDILLVQLVKLRLFSEKVGELSWPTSTYGTDKIAMPPIAFYLKSLQTQLQQLKTNIPEKLSKNYILLTELYTAERLICESGLSQAPDAFRGQENRRTECLWGCLKALKCWINVFLSIPPAEYTGFSALTFSNMKHFFLSMYRLSIFEHAEWDRELCREHLDVPSLLEAAAQKFASVKELACLDEGDTFSVMAARIQMAKLSWDAATASQVISQSPNEDHHELYDFLMEF